MYLKTPLHFLLVLTRTAVGTKFSTTTSGQDIARLIRQMPTLTFVLCESSSFQTDFHATKLSINDKLLRLYCLIDYSTHHTTPFSNLQKEFYSVKPCYNEVTSGP